MIKRFISLFLIILIFFSFNNLAIAQEENNREDIAVEEKKEDITIEEKKFGPYKDKQRYYENIDSITYEEAEANKDSDNEEGGFSLNPITWISNYVQDKTDEFTNSLQDAILAMFMSLIQLGFSMNVAFTEWMLTVLSFSNDANIMNWLIDGVAGKVQTVAGISDNQILEGSGIFGKLLGIFTLISVLYVVYQALVKRAPIESLKSLIQPIIAIALSILVISNFTTYLKGINDLGNELSDNIITLTSEDEKGAYNSMEDKLWKIFVHRPYLYIQFGTDNEGTIGKERIENILLYKQDDKKKRNAIKKEVTEYNNEMMQPSTVIKRLVYVGLFNVSNGILSIPIWLLSAALIGLQIWFIVVACFAPFILVWSTLPHQFGILKRYAEALLYPVIFKLIVSFIALILFTISDVVYSLPLTDGLAGYIIATFLQFIIFIIAFVFRNRIKKIFERGATGYQHVRESWNLGKDTAGKPVKSSIQGTATATGTAIGAMVGGPQGAMMGASLGQQAGNTLTGDADLKDLPMQALKTYAHGKMAQQGDGLSEIAATTENVKEGESQGGGKDENQVDSHSNLQDIHAVQETAGIDHGEKEQSESGKHLGEQVKTNDAYMDLADIDDYKPKQSSDYKVQSAHSVQQSTDTLKENSYYDSQPFETKHVGPNDMHSNLVDLNSFRSEDQIKTDMPVSESNLDKTLETSDMNDTQSQLSQTQYQTEDLEVDIESGKHIQTSPDVSKMKEIQSQPSQTQQDHTENLKMNVKSEGNKHIQASLDVPRNKDMMHLDDMNEPLKGDRDE